MTDQKQMHEPFVKFWNDFLTKAGVEYPHSDSASPAFSDAAKQMQRVFFDSMAKYAEEFMRSEQFLTAMKQTMDQSLQMKKVFDDFLVKAQRGVQAPVRADVDDIASLMRAIENRVLNRLDALEDKIAAVEVSQEEGRGADTKKASRPSGPATGQNRQPPKRKR